MSTWRRVGCRLFAAVAAVGCAFGAAAETHWEWTQQGEKVTLAERGAETAWKFTLTKKGVLSLAAVGRTEKLDFGELPEDCPYAIRELAPNFLCADGSSRSAGGNGAAGLLEGRRRDVGRLRPGAVLRSARPGDDLPAEGRRAAARLLQQEVPDRFLHPEDTLFASRAVRLSLPGAGFSIISA